MDPGSNFNQGSILGDKTRMEKLSQSASALFDQAHHPTIWEVSDATHQNIQLCEIAGFDVIIVESVRLDRVRQNYGIWLTFYTLGTGYRRHLQRVKRGILECCDAIFIDKSDLGGAKKRKVSSTTLYVLQREILLEPNSYALERTERRPHARCL